MDIDLDELKRLVGLPGDIGYNKMAFWMADHAQEIIAEIERLQAERNNDLKGRLDALSDDQRLELFGRYCKHCGCKQSESGGFCQCWNDE